MRTILKTGLFTIIALLLFSACDNYKDEYDNLLAEKASLQKKINNMQEEDQSIRGEYSDAIETLNAIEDTLRAIAEREKDIQKLTQSSEFSGNLSQQQSILRKLQALKNANEQSKDEAKRLQSQLSAYRVENDQLRKMIAAAETKILMKEQELDEAQNIIDDLRGALNKKEAQLLESQGELASAYEDLKNKNRDLKQTNARLNSTIDELKQKTVFIEEQARGYVACGTKRTLRQKGILNKMNTKLTKGYQSAVRANSSSVNYFENDVMECGTDGAIIEVLPERDVASYKVDGNKLTVLDAEVFWKTDKIVVLVKD